MSTGAEEMAARRPRRSRRGVLWIAMGAIVVAAVILGAGALSGWFSSPAITLVGAGATFPDPLIRKWSSAYVTVTGVRVNYQAVGSGAGISQITAKTVDFAGSDAPLSATERAAAPGLLHIPETLGAVTAAYNLPGIPSGLNLTGDILVYMFLGSTSPSGITMWNDPSIAAVNPGVSLPAQAISVVHRSDGSGTTFVWTSYLHLANSAWNTSLVGKNPAWPVGIGAQGNAGVAGKILQTPYSIGYVELAYTVQNSMTVAKIENPAGNFVLPSLASTASAAAAAAPTLPTSDGDWSGVSILMAPGAGSYPVSSLTYLLVYKELNAIGPSMTQARAKALVDFIWWAVSAQCPTAPATCDGQSYSTALVYVPLPQSVVTLDEQGLRNVTFNGQTLRT